MSDVRINIDFANGTLDIEGDSEFVDKQVARFESEIKQQLLNKYSSVKSSSNTHNLAQASSNDCVKGSAKEEPTVSDSSYDDIFEIHDDKTHIVKDIPGGSFKEKIVCVSLLLSLGESLRGNDTTPIDDIRSECHRHGCMDNKNFATYVKSYNTLMIDSGAGKSATLKLTMPGSKTAKDLVRRIREGGLGDFFSTLKPKTKTKTKTKTKAKSKSSTQKAEKDAESGSTTKTRGRPGPGEILTKLAEDGFFSSPKSSENIIDHCKDNLAYTYEMTEISSSLTRATRNNLLTRSKDENGQYEYTSA